ncbi:MAG: hypothetical protein HY889_08515 [Deltaproteobacteria bacterium]|nr:hypothetical protein [Deltaproteobacteria bacterium]
MPDRKKKENPAKPLELVLGAALLIVWCAGSAESFKAEALALKVIPEAVRLTYEEKKSLMDGHIYRLSQEASSVIPSGSRVYLFTPTAAENASYYFLKSRYYLYPRKVIDGGSTELRTKELLECDYLVVYIPRMAAYGGAVVRL